MSTKQCTPEKRKRPINGPHPTPLRIKQDSHAIRKPSIFSSHEKPKIIHTNARDFKTLVQRLTGLSSQPNDQEFKINGKRPMDDDVVYDHHCKGSMSDFHPIPLCSSMTNSHPHLIDMSYPYLGHHHIPNSTNFSYTSPVYTYAERISFPTLPNIGSSISPVKKEFLDIERIIGFGSLNDRECWPWVFKGKKMEVPCYGKNEGGQRLMKQEEFVPR